MTTSNRYLVVDLMSGGDLRFHISRKTFTEEAVRFWIAELGCALRYIHGQGIIHRDVKPDNVLLDADGHVHLTDFVSLFTLAHGSRQHNSKQLTFCYPECRIGRCTRQSSYEQIGNTSISRPRSLRRQRLRYSSRLVVIGCPLLRMHL